MTRDQPTTRTVIDKAKNGAALANKHDALNPNLPPRLRVETFTIKADDFWRQQLVELGILTAEEAQFTDLVERRLSDLVGSTLRQMIRNQIDE